LVLTRKKPNSADISDDISDVSSKTIIHCRFKIMGIYPPPIASAGLALKVAEHSFQEPMPNSPLLLSYLCFGARFLPESRLTTEGFILAFWLRCVLLPW